MRDEESPQGPKPVAVAITSLSGAPGVTTTALLLAASWPRRVVMVECDPSGGDVAPWWGLRSSPGLATLAASLGREGVRQSNWDHVQRVGGGMEVITGVSGAAQAAAVDHLWPGLVSTTASMGADLIFDLGRCPGTRWGGLAEVCKVADLLVVVTRADLAAVSHLRAGRDLLRRLQEDVVVAVVGESPYHAHEVAALAGLDLLGVLPMDDRAVAAVRGEARRAGSFHRSRLFRVSREMCAALVSCTRDRALLDSEERPGGGCEEAQLAISGDVAKRPGAPKAVDCGAPVPPPMQVRVR